MGRAFPLLTILALAVAFIGCGTADVGPTSPPVASVTPTVAPASIRTPTPTATYPANVLDRPNFSPLEPAAYFIEPESIPVRVNYTILAEGWVSWIGTFKQEEAEDRRHRYVGMSIVNVTTLVVHGCTDHTAVYPPVGPTVDDLATALAALPPFIVTAPPSDVTIYGYSGKYLQLTVPDMPVTLAGDESYFPDCRDRELKSWIGPPLSYAFYGYTEPGQNEEFWILDVDGSRLVIEASWSPDSPTGDIAELRAILASVQIEPMP